ncbi:restriction endonuclease subunit R [Trichocoleus sp. Lan]|uniref:restriction endonuclease subunit R n=1 Tax=Trichocoleus sp. Lan TaxID=2933927 RepID=UPI003296E619
MTTLNARNLFLDDVHRLLNFQEQYNGSFTPLLSLEPLTEFEQQELLQIWDDFRHYLTAGKVLEGQVKLLTVAPLLRLASFYCYPIHISLEEGIADINITDEDTIITGRLDILAVKKTHQTTANVSFWVLVIEAKNSQVEAFTGLPQLLTYAHKSLEHQTSIWGLTTNGLRYQLVYIQRGNPPTYLLMPELNLIDSERLTQLLQVLKAICKVIG